MFVRIFLAALAAIPLLSIVTVASHGQTCIFNPEAEYRVEFTATWSAETLPTGFPPDPHFSGLVGGSHSADVSFWSPGGIANQSIEYMAESGIKDDLLEDVNAAIVAGTALDAISGGPIGTSPGFVATTFSVNLANPLATVVTMIAPSPDWFVGTHGYNLFVDGNWLEEASVDLYGYDAGTDSGVTYTSSNADITPHVPIELLDGPMFMNGGTLVPFGTFRFVRLTESCRDTTQDHGGAFTNALSDGRPARVIAVDLQAAGDYRLTVDDLGLPAALDSLDIALLNDTGIVTALDTAGSREFSVLDPSLALLIFADPAAPGFVGTLSINISAVSDGAVVFNVVEVFEEQRLTGPELERTYEFSLSTPQQVDVMLEDLHVPAALQTLQLQVLNEQSSPVAIVGPGESVSPVLGSGHYRVFTSASTNPADPASGSGSYRVRIKPAISPPVTTETVVIGDDVARQSISLNDGNTVFSVVDLSFPAPLESLTAVLVGADSRLELDLTSAVTNANLTAGDYELLVAASPADEAGAAYVVNVLQGSARVGGVANFVPQATSDATQNEHVFTVSSTQEIELTVTDFGFPAGLSALTSIVLGESGVVASLSGAGVTRFTATPGDYWVLSRATAATGNSGLFGVMLSDQTNALMLESTEVVGAVGDVGQVNGVANQTVTIALDDLEFPAPFELLSLAVTRGTETVGSVFSGGTVSFDVTESGEYQYTLIAKTDVAKGAGTYDLNISSVATPIPPPPPPPAPAPQQNSGGSGAVPPWLLLWLIVVLAIRRRWSLGTD